MSYLSPIAQQTKAPTASCPGDSSSSLAQWGVSIGSQLEIVRNALAAKLSGLERSQIDTTRAKIEAALAECDAIEAQAATLVKPYQARYESILGHLVADLAAAVAHAENAAKIDALQAHTERLEVLKTIANAANPDQEWR